MQSSVCSVARWDTGRSPWGWENFTGEEWKWCSRSGRFSQGFYSMSEDKELAIGKTWWAERENQSDGTKSLCKKMMRKEEWDEAVDWKAGQKHAFLILYGRRIVGGWEWRGLGKLHLASLCTGCGGEWSQRNQVRGYCGRSTLRPGLWWGWR